MTKYHTLIVGAHFRPPAKQCLAHCASGTGLILEEENDNPYDAAAVRVMLDPQQIPDTEYATLEPELLGAGVTLEQLLSGGPIHIGFVPAQEGKPLAKARLSQPDLLGNQQVREIMMSGDMSKSDVFGSHPYSCALDFAADGSPRLTIIVEDCEL